jgi:hypothetical protein
LLTSGAQKLNTNRQVGAIDFDIDGVGRRVGKVEVGEGLE